MPRQARIVVPELLHHVTQRGNYGQRIFYEDQDRAVYLKYVNQNAIKYGVSIYAFCLMNNHVHFIVSPSHSKSLADTFKTAHQKYALYLNRRLEVRGHRWQARFYSCLVVGKHIQNSLRYVERNPVRANIVKHPWLYPWSSARAHLGKTYNLINLSDINDYVDIDCWKTFLAVKENKESLKNIRQNTRQGKACGPRKVLKSLEKKLDIQLVKR